MNNILEVVKNEILISDGAMGTMLYNKGIFLNRCFDEVNLSSPQMIKDIHHAYIKAGSDIITTNTFGANYYRLKQQDFHDKVYDINISGARLARECAKNKVFVAGSIGPLGLSIEDYKGGITKEEAHKAFLDQAKVLEQGEVDFFILESFNSLNELALAIDAINHISKKIIIAQMSLDKNGLIDNKKPSIAMKSLDKLNADIIGLNCSNGVMDILKPIEDIVKITKKPVIVQPNAGLPREEQGRQVYLCTPEYLATYTKAFIQMGVRVVGGCCGTSPEHIKEIKLFVRSIAPLKKEDKGIDYSEKVPDVKVIPIEDRSNFAKKIAKGDFVTTVEITPPKGCDPSKIIEKAAILKDKGVDAVNIPDGPRASSRMSSMLLSQIIESQVGIETIMHYCCRDRNLLGMQSDLLGGYAAGLKNVLIITGDPPKMGDFPDASPVFDVDSIGLTRMVNNFNHGLDMIAKTLIGKPTGYLIGVGVNPGALDLNLEVDRFYQKVDAGANFAITQPIFDIEVLFKFLDEVKGIKVPIIAGIWPLVSYRNALFMDNEVPGVNVPIYIMDALKVAPSKEKALEKGIEIANKTLLQVRHRIQGVQISAPFGRVDYALRVLGIA